MLMPQMRSKSHVPSHHKIYVLYEQRHLSPIGHPEIGPTLASTMIRSPVGGWLVSLVISNWARAPRAVEMPSAGENLIINLYVSTAESGICCRRERSIKA
jgi:hypothetical protein